MIRIHVLSERAVNQNTRAFLSPIIWNRRRILDRGLSVRIFYEPTPDIGDCDVLAINGKYWSGPWDERRDQALAWLAALKGDVGRIIFFDRSSTAGHLIVDVLPLVDTYCKTILYRDRAVYLRPLYGSRLFCDHYHQELGLEDDEPTFSTAAPDLASLDKLEGSWNTGLVNYSLHGPRLATLFSHLPLRAFLAPPTTFYEPSISRAVDVTCRMGLHYKYNTVAYQRRKMAELLAHHRKTDRIGKTAYFKELRNSKVVASPFGSSEINYRDFETFICGALLLKPDMSHIESYPDLYHPGETFVAHSWDFEDLEDAIEEILSHYDRFVEIARAGQDLYRWHVASDEGHEAFVDRFERLMRGQPPAHDAADHGLGSPRAVTPARNQQKPF
jgi:hypothetical protein